MLSTASIRKHLSRFRLQQLSISLKFGSVIRLQLVSRAFYSFLERHLNKKFLEHLCSLCRTGGCICCFRYSSKLFVRRDVHLYLEFPGNLKKKRFRMKIVQHGFFLNSNYEFPSDKQITFFKGIA